MAAAWFLFILILLTGYILLDGYDLGAGVISLFAGKRASRHEIVEKVGTIWDGNEVWLVLLGVSLFSGFPLAFGIMMPHLFLPVIVVLLALILRGVSIELISQRGREAGRRWYLVFGIASLVAAFAQGFALGGLAAPVQFSGTTYQGSPFDVFTWFSVLMGITVTLGYVALGYAFLELHGVGDPAVATRRGVIVSILAVVAAAASLISINATAAPLDLSTPVRAFSFWGLLIFAAAGAVIAVASFRRTRKAYGGNIYPFGGLAIFVVAVLSAFAVSHYPVLVPPDLTVDVAVGPPETMWFLFVAFGLNLPLLAYYTWFAHSKFGLGVRIAQVRSDESELRSDELAEKDELAEAEKGAGRHVD